MSTSEATPVWDLSAFYASDDDPRIKADMAVIEAAVSRFCGRWKDKINESLTLEDLLKALGDYARLMWDYEASGSPSYYFYLRSFIEAGNDAVTAGLNQTEEFDNRMENQLTFFELDLGLLPEELKGQAVEDSRFAPYRHWLERLFRAAKHKLAAAEEQIVNRFSAGAYRRWMAMTSRELSTQLCLVTTESGSRERLPLSELSNLAVSEQKRVRNGAARAYNRTMAHHTAMATAEVNALLEYRKVLDELRGYTRPEAHRLLNDDIEPEVFDCLVATVADSYELAHRYYRLKARVMDVGTLAYHERALPLGSLKRYSYTEAATLVRQVLLGLDHEFATIFDSLQKMGRFDVAPRTGKVGGAFVFNPGAKRFSNYVLLNHTGQLRDVRTLAHESGHAINQWLVKEGQNALNCNVPTSTAEVASTFFEDFVVAAAIRKADPTMQFYIRMAQLDDETNLLFAQVAICRFEQKLHSLYRLQGAVSTAEIQQLYRKSAAAYCGDAVDLKGSENRWVNLWHIRQYFYGYTYPMGLIISKAMQAMVAEDPQSIVLVKEFLAAGGSASPKAIFAMMGIDIVGPTFWQRGLAGYEAMVTSAEQNAEELGLI